MKIVCEETTGFSSQSSKLNNFLHVVIVRFTTKELVYDETFENHKQ